MKQLTASALGSPASPGVWRVASAPTPLLTRHTPWPVGAAASVAPAAYRAADSAYRAADSADRAADRNRS